MRTLFGILERGRHIFFSRILFLAPRRIHVFPKKSCMISIPIGSTLISPFVMGVTEVIINIKLISTQASLDEDEVLERNLNQIFASIENAPRSSAKICSAYLGNLCKVGDVSIAVRLLQALQDKNIFIGYNAYDIVLEAAAGKNNIEILSWVFKNLLKSNESLSPASYLNLAKGFKNNNDCVLLLGLMKEVSHLAFPSSTIVINRIIHAFANTGQFDKSLLIFDQMRDLRCKPDLVTHNTILNILGRADRIDEMLREFGSMKEEGTSPDFISYNTVLNHLQKAGQLDLCLVYIKEMVESGIEPDLLTYTALIHGFGQLGRIEESLRLFNEMKMKQVRPSIYIYRSLIGSLKKMGKMELAKKLLEEMKASLPNLAGPGDFKRKGRRWLIHGDDFNLSERQMLSNYEQQ